MVGKQVILRWTVVLFVFGIGIYIAMGIMSRANEDRKPQLIVYGPRNDDGSVHTISDFKLTDQNGNVVTNETFKNKIYIADFIFTTCQGICPVMSDQMERVY